MQPTNQKYEMKSETNEPQNGGGNMIKYGTGVPVSKIARFPSILR